MDTKITLSARMEMLLAMAEKGKIFADIGCDHGYVTIAAIQRNLYEKGIAMDINKGPLEAAKNNARSYGIANKVEFRLSDGLEKLDENEADTILIAGMGGPLICDILSREMKVAKSADKLIISPQSEIPSFRKFVLDNGFKIEDEEILKDDGKYYFVFRLSVSKENEYPLGELGLKYGGILLEKKHPVLKEYLEKQKNIILELMEKPGIAGTSKEEEFKTEYQYLNESMECF